MHEQAADAEDGSLWHSEPIFGVGVFDFNRSEHGRHAVIIRFDAQGHGATLEPAQHPLTAGMRDMYPNVQNQPVGAAELNASIAARIFAAFFGVAILFEIALDAGISWGVFAWDVAGSYSCQTLENSHQTGMSSGANDTASFMECTTPSTGSGWLSRSCKPDVSLAVFLFRFPSPACGN